MSTTETPITEQIHRGEYDDMLGQIMLAVHQRNKRLEALEGKPIVKRFVEVVRENPGLTAHELAIVADMTPSRVYQLVRMSERFLKPHTGTNPRRLYAKDSHVTNEAPTSVA